MAKKRNTSEETVILPIAEKLFATAKKDPEFRVQYLRQALRLGKCKDSLEVETKFNKADHYVLFLRDVGVI